MRCALSALASLARMSAKRTSKGRRGSAGRGARSRHRIHLRDRRALVRNSRLNQVDTAVTSSLPVRNTGDGKRSAHATLDGATGPAWYEVLSSESALTAGSLGGSMKKIGMGLAVSASVVSARLLLHRRMRPFLPARQSPTRRSVWPVMTRLPVLRRDRRSPPSRTPFGARPRMRWRRHRSSGARPRCSPLRATGSKPRADFSAL